MSPIPDELPPGQPGASLATVDVLVIGCGRIGSSLATALSDAGHAVTVLDRDKGAFKRLPESWSGRTVAGWAFDRDDLERAGITSAGAVAAVTSGDNSNILAARIAREAYGVERVVARIYDPRRAEIYARLGIPIVGTVRWATDQVQRRLFPELSAVDWTDATGTGHVVERVVPDAAVGRKLGALDLGANARVMAIGRSGGMTFADDAAVLQHGDRLVVMVLGDVNDFDTAATAAFAEGGSH
jgi:trk system potassium uptake protein